MDCGTIGNGLQVAGAAIELWALLGIVWRPWLRPRLVKAWAALVSHVERLWPFSRHKSATVELSGAGGAKAGGHAIIGVQQGPGDKPDAEPRERIDLLVKRVATLEERPGETEQRFAQELSEKWEAVLSEARAGCQELSEKLAEIESTAIRIRTNDALRFAAGVAVALVGAAWGTFC